MNITGDGERHMTGGKLSFSFLPFFCGLIHWFGMADTLYMASDISGLERTGFGCCMT